MNNKKVFISMVDMNDSKTQIVDINVVYKNVNKGFRKIESPESNYIRKKVRSAEVRKPYSIEE